MKKFSRLIYIAILACLPVISLLYAKSSTDSVESKPKILVEAMIVQVSREALDKLQVGGNVEPLSEVTVPLAMLLYLFADPNAIKVTAKPKLLIYASQTGKLYTGQELKYLIKKENGSFEQKTTDEPIGTTLEATPFIDKDGDILLNFKFEHFSIIEPPKEIDPQTSLPIGGPIIDCSSVNSRLKLKSGEPMIAGGSVKSGAQQFILVRAEILKE